MAYTLIKDLPYGGSAFGIPVDAPNDLLVLEQDITRKVPPLVFLEDTIPQLTEFNLVTNTDYLIYEPTGGVGQKVSVDTFMYYVNTHLNAVDEVFYVSSVSGVDSTDFVMRGKNEQLPFRTIKYAAQQISKRINEDKNYPKNPSYENPLNPTLDPNFVQDIAPPTISSVENSQKIRRQYTIMVRSGDYVEDNPVYLPPNTSMIGDNLRRTTIRPLNPLLDLFWVDSANYIWGFTFRNLKDPAAAVAFPISTAVYQKSNDGPILSQYAPSKIQQPNGQIVDYTPITPNSNGWVQDCYYIAYLKELTDVNLNTNEPAIHPNVVPQNRPFIYVSPYVQGCTSYSVSDRMPNNIVGDNTNNPLYPETWILDSNDPNSAPLPNVPPQNNAGMGMRIDGSLVDGYFRSMVIDSYTQINQGGRGIYLLNHGYAQFVSTFTVATYQGIVCEAGATCSISTSNSTFGLSGLVASGKSYSEVLSGRFVIPDTPGAYPKPSETFANGNTFGVYGYQVGSNLFTINDATPMPVYYPFDDVSDVAAKNNGNPMTVASQPYATLCFTVGDDKPWISSYEGTEPRWSGPGYLMEEDVNPTVQREVKSFFPDSPNANKKMSQVKLFYIEQGPPTPALSGGSTLNNGVYDIYQEYGLSQPENPLVQPNVKLPWDIQLSFNLQLDLKVHTPVDAYDEVDGTPLHYNINYLGKPEPINYQIFSGGTLTPIASGTPLAQTQFELNVLNNAIGKDPNNNYAFRPRGSIDFTNAPVKFYARSVIETGSHTFEYMGTGTRMKYAIPAFGGITNNINETAADGFNDAFGNAPGTVFFTSSNELGNFKVGRDFTIVQSTGTIEGETFSRAILTLVTPLNIVLD
jgi:hypothetical protein